VLRGSLEMQDAKNRQKIAIWASPSSSSSQVFLKWPKQQRHHEDIVQLCRATSSAMSPPHGHNMVNFGVLAAEICWRVCGTPANFNGFRVLAALLHSTLVVGVSQTLRR